MAADPLQVDVRTLSISDLQRRYRLDYAHAVDLHHDIAQFTPAAPVEPQLLNSRFPESYMNAVPPSVPEPPSAIRERIHRKATEDYTTLFPALDAAACEALTVLEERLREKTGNDWLDKDYLSGIGQAVYRLRMLRRELGGDRET